MPKYFKITTFAIFLSLLIYVFWTWKKWFSSKANNLSNWRFVASGVALLCATISTALSEFMYVHDAYTGGYPFYHPVELFCIRFGFLSASVGVLLSVTSRGMTRINILAISVVNLALWYIDGMAQ